MKTTIKKPGQGPESGSLHQKDLQQKIGPIILFALIKNPDYRELFNEKKSKFEETDMINHVKENLKKDHSESVKTHNQGIVNTFGRILCSVYHNFERIDSLGGGVLVTGDIQDDIGAFVMGYSESVNGHGIRKVGQYGVYKGNKVVASNRYTIRGAYASESDHWELSFNEVKILGVKDDKIIIGLNSGQLLTIKEISLKSGNISTLESYDLAQEKKEEEKKKLKEAMEKETDWKVNLKNVSDLIYRKYNYEYDIHHVNDPILFDDFAIFTVNQHNRKYDAMVTYVDFYVYGKDFPEPIKVKSHYCEYDRSRFSSRRFFSVDARTTIEQKDDKNLEATIKISSENRRVRENKVNISFSNK